MRQEREHERWSNGDGKILARFLSVIVGISMVMSLVPTQGIAWALEEYAHYDSDQALQAEGAQEELIDESVSGSVSGSMSGSNVQEYVPVEEEPAYQIQSTPIQLSVDGDNTPEVTPEVTPEQVQDTSTSVALQPVTVTDGEQNSSASNTNEPAEPVVEDEKNDQSSFTYETSAIKVTATLDDPTVLPKGVRFVVTQITENAKSHDAYMGALNASAAESDTYSDKNTLLYDVSFLATDEENNEVEIEPEQGSVKVNFEFKQNQLAKQLDAKDTADVEVTHLPVVTSAKDATTSAANQDISKTDVAVQPLASNEVTALSTREIELTATSFSVYAFSYTVDFTYDGYSYSIKGEGDIRLSDLFQTLNIDADVAHVKSVTFSNSELVRVDKSGDDWLLTSLKPFTTSETLTVEMASGARYVIDATDEQSMAYTARVEFYDYNKTTLSPYAGNDQTLYVYAELKDSEGTVLGWNVQPFNPSSSETTHLVTFDKFQDPAKSKDQVQTWVTDGMV
ncbi:MAG: hypothetical protein Q4B54_14185, partial [Coriobacteriales bacterium]|nr:hypothetical protein [Coriobacteriales bacterium]